MTTYQMIKSPGVQITEKDLSLRTVIPTGTVVFVPGFASQGPISEPIQITTASEFESIFGTPTNDAEKYFYYTCNEILQTPGRLLAGRLPYGPGEGTTFTNKVYSGLFYPMASGFNAELESVEWVIGQPVHKALSVEEYNQLIGGNFQWSGTSKTPIYKYASLNPTTGEVIKNEKGQVVYDNIVGTNKAQCVSNPGFAQVFPVGTGLLSATPSNDIAAGFFILNDIQSTINEVGEGYYVGIADNTSMYPDSPNFDSIKDVFTLVSSDGAFATVEKSRFDFALSATKIDSDAGITSVSENLEKVGFVGFGDDLFQDHISMGMFRIRRSATDPTKLTLGTSEKYIGSFDKSRKTQNPAGGSPVNAYIEDLVDNDSPTVKMAINPAISKFDWTFGANGLTPVARVTVSEAAKKLYALGSFIPDTRSTENSKIIGEVPNKLIKLLRLIENPENIDVDLVLDAGLSTVFATTYTEQTTGNAAFSDSKFVVMDKVYNESWQSVTDVLVDFCESTRKDCMAILDPPRHLFINGADVRSLDLPSANFTQTIANPLRNLLSKSESNYAACYANWIKVNDSFSSRRFWLPPSGPVGKIFVNNDAVAAPWYAPAGLNRGTFNALDIAFNPNMKQRDTLYEMSANPITFFQGDGFTVMGQKTIQHKPTAFDRVNVRRLFLVLERATAKTLRYFVFEPNTVAVRRRLVNTIQPLFDSAKNNEGLYDYLIVCDERNNTPDTIDQNQLIVDIYLKPVKAAEFILVNFIATRTGQEFSELI